MENKRVLIIDDEENIRYMLQLTLESEGYEVELASNGTEGIQQVHQNHFDFIICDLKMPGISGLEVLASVTESSPNTPIIMISAFGTVGLSTGITSEFSTAGKAILIVTMFAGRIGPLTLVLGMSYRQAREVVQYPNGQIPVG